MKTLLEIMGKYRILDDILWGLKGQGLTQGVQPQFAFFVITMEL